MSLTILGGHFKNRKLFAPNEQITRPTTALVRAAIFNMTQHLIEGASFLDLFAGSGAMGLEAISRGAARVTFLENNKDAFDTIEKNINHLKVNEKANVIRSDAVTFLKRASVTYDLIYLDPPYDYPKDDLFSSLANLSSLSPQGILFIEERFDSKAVARTIEGLKLKESRRYGITWLHVFIKST
jgi:16S rRNA (guanine966-N2)-methyltransferase